MRVMCLCMCELGFLDQQTKLTCLGLINKFVDGHRQPERVGRPRTCATQRTYAGDCITCTPDALMYQCLCEASP